MASGPITSWEIDVPSYIPTKSAGKFSSLRILCNMYCWRFSKMPILTGMRWELTGLLICLPLTLSETEHLFKCLMAMCIPSSWNVHWDLWPISYWVFLFYFWYWAAWALCMFWRWILCGDLCFEIFFFPILKVVFFFHLGFPLLWKCC